MWIITKFTGSTPVRRPYAVNPGENSYKPHMLWNHSSLASFLSRTVKAMLIHSVTQLRKHNIHVRTSSVPSVKRTLSWIRHSRSFKVILIGACLQRRKPFFSLSIFSLSSFYNENVEIAAWDNDNNVKLLNCYSDTNRRELMRKIKAGEFEFVAPYWNEISDSAKVSFIIINVVSAYI